MKFPLKETELTIRDVTFRVKELTHAERLQWVKESQDNRLRGPALLVSLGVVAPEKLTEEDAGELPSEVVTELTLAVMKVSGMKTAKDGEESEKKSDA